MGKQSDGGGQRSKFKRNQKRTRTTMIKQNMQNPEQPFDEETTARIKEQGHDPNRIRAIGKYADGVLVDMIATKQYNPAEALMVAGNIILSVITSQAPSRAAALITVIEMVEGLFFAVHDGKFDEEGTIPEEDGWMNQIINIVYKENKLWTYEESVNPKKWGPDEDR
jgi:hypothetical protein